jgi:hypothetical protein
MPKTPNESESKPSDIASVSVPDTLAVLHANPETALTHTEVDTRHAVIRAVAGFAIAVTAVTGLLHGLLTVN